MSLNYSGGRARLARGRTRGTADGMNRTEAAYLRDMILPAVAAGTIAWWAYEPLKFRLADRTYYSPDFIVQLADGTIEIHEVKGWAFEHDARVKFKVCAEHYPMFRWRAFRPRPKRDGGGWHEFPS